MRLVFQRDGAFPLKVEQSNDGLRFNVTYGQEDHRGLSYTKAAHQLGECLFHSLCCEECIETPESGKGGGAS